MAVLGTSVPVKPEISLNQTSFEICELWVAICDLRYQHPYVNTLEEFTVDLDQRPYCTTTERFSTSHTTNA